MLNELRLRIETQRLALGQLDNDAEDDELVALVDRQEEVAQRLTDLQSRREALAVDAELSGSGVVFLSPAEVATPTGFSIYLVLGVFVGMIIAGMIAYVLARLAKTSRSRRTRELWSSPNDRRPALLIGATEDGSPCRDRLVVRRRQRRSARRSRYLHTADPRDGNGTASSRPWP